jgi:uncharacterized protein (DUF305 family)
VVGVAVPLAGVAAVLALTGLPACSSPSANPTSTSTSTSRPSTVAPSATAADADFVRHMLVHHGRALELGQAARDRGTDARVRAFGTRILTEQTPERGHLQEWVTALGIAPMPETDHQGAAGYVTDDAYRRLLAEPAPAFDRDALLLSASSEQGAVEMSRTELAAGTYAPARELATSIVGAQDGEIPELRRLAADLPG